jgi:DNA-directed RNA polymerase specialized sigma subunit
MRRRLREDSVKKLEIGRRIREKLGPVWRRRRARRQREGREQDQVMHELEADFSTEELQEFLEADLHSVEADPVFKEALRLRLWELVQERQRAREDEPDA